MGERAARSVDRCREACLIADGKDRAGEADRRASSVSSPWFRSVLANETVSWATSVAEAVRGTGDARRTVIGAGCPSRLARSQVGNGAVNGTIAITISHPAASLLNMDDRERAKETPRGARVDVQKLERNTEVRSRGN
jgi:hypothetical protein